MPPSTATDDDTSSPRNNRKRKASVFVPEAIQLARDARGECPTCGMRVREKVGSDMIPMTRPGQVEDGRCLHCHWDHPLEEETLVPSEISVTGAAEEARAEDEAPAPAAGEANNEGDTPSVIKLMDTDGDEYVGLVTEGTEEKGRGVFSHVYKDGDLKGKVETYEGEFHSGLFEGHGTWRWATGTVYEGEFKKGELDGHGKLNWQDGKGYEGEFKNDVFNGKGTYKWPDGSRYEGEFKDDFLHGKGKFFYKNGDVYKGHWRNDKRHGQGERRYADGRIENGEWRENKFVG